MCGRCDALGFAGTETMGLRRNGTENLHKGFWNAQISYSRAPDARA